MEERPVYSEKMGEKYTRSKHGIRFESGPEYTNLELKILAPQSLEMLRAIHLAKKIFRAAVISADNKLKKNNKNP